MANPNARKGSDWERAVRRYLEEWFGRQVRRPRQEGFRDVSDLHLSPFVLQAKNWKDTTAALREGVNGAELQAVHAGEAYGVAVIKSRNKPAADGRVAMTLRTFRRVAHRILLAEKYLARHAPDAFEAYGQELAKGAR